MKRLLALAVTLLSLASVAPAQTIITKPPDQGPFWNPLSPGTGSYVYADCFIAPAGTDVWPQSLGTWLSVSTPPAPTVRFELWADGSGPVAGSILATTGSLSPNPTGLELISAPVLPTALQLTPGQRYWFVATVVGESGTGAFQVGAHTQNSSYNDNCTFWYSNDPAGVVFDGQDNVPEMAFSLTLADTPVPVELLSFSVDGDD